MSNRKAFAAIMFPIAAAYGRQMNEQAIKLYWMHLQCFEPDELYRAVHEHVADQDRGRWFPTVADILAKLSGSHALMGEQAWVRIASQQPLETVTDLDAVRRMGGSAWLGRLGKLRIDSPEFRDQKRLFLSAHAEAARHAHLRALPDSRLAIADAQRAIGHE